MDREPLQGLAGRLREIAKIVDGFAEMASDVPSGGGDSESIEQVEAGFAAIREALEGINTPGDNSAKYIRIEAALGSLTHAIRRLWKGRRE